MMGSEAYDTIATLTQRNFERWRAVQDEIFKAMIGNANASSASSTSRQTEHDGDGGETPREKRM